MQKTINNVSEFIAYSKDFSEQNSCNSVQADLNTDNHKEFMEYLVGISEEVFVDELGGLQRVMSDKPVEEVLESITPETTLKSGVKTVHKPCMNLYDRDSWEGGYIEGFWTGGEGHRYFIWTYTRMDRLQELLEKWGEQLTYWEF